VFRQVQLPHYRSVPLVYKHEVVADTVKKPSQAPTLQTTVKRDTATVKKQTVQPTEPTAAEKFGCSNKSTCCVKQRSIGTTGEAGSSHGTASQTNAGRKKSSLPQRSPGCCKKKYRPIHYHSGNLPFVYLNTCSTSWHLPTCIRYA